MGKSRVNTLWQGELKYKVTATVSRIFLLRLTRNTLATTSRLRRPSLEHHRAPVTDKGTWLTAKMAGEAEAQSYSYSFENFSSSTDQEYARDYIQVKTSIAGASPCACHKQKNMADGQSQRSYTLPYGGLDCW